MNQEPLLNESLKNYYAKKEEANAAVASKTENVKLSQSGLPENQFNGDVTPQMPKFDNVDEYIKNLGLN